jgi:predicted esterase
MKDRYHRYPPKSNNECISFEALVSPLLQETLKQWDSIARAETFKHRTIELMYGEKDRLVPRSANINFENELKKHNAKLNVIVDEEVGHECSEKMKEATLNMIHSMLQ